MSNRIERTNDKKTVEKHQRILKDLLQLPDNRICADCKKRDPRWASANLGIFICLRCSGVHRSLGVHISKVRSVDLDTWVPEHIEIMSRWGNARANKYWEHQLQQSSSQPPVIDDSKMESFIRNKYEYKKFVRPGPMPEPETLDEGSGAQPQPQQQNIVSQPQKSQSQPAASAATATSFWGDFSGLSAAPPAVSVAQAAVSIAPVDNFNPWSSSAASVTTTSINQQQQQQQQQQQKQRQPSVSGGGWADFTGFQTAAPSFQQQQQQPASFSASAPASQLVSPTGSNFSGASSGNKVAPSKADILSLYNAKPPQSTSPTAMNYSGGNFGVLPQHTGPFGATQNNNAFQPQQAFAGFGGQMQQQQQQFNQFQPVNINSVGTGFGGVQQHNQQQPHQQPQQPQQQQWGSLL